MPKISRTQDEGRRPNGEGGKSRATAERFEAHVKELIEKLTKELGPVGEELRKTLEKSIDEIHETLKKDGVTSDDVRKALEKSHNEMRKAFEKGGSVNKELRESMEKSRRDLQEEWERARNELRSAMRERLESRRQQERGREVEKERQRSAEGSAEIDESERNLRRHATRFVRSSSSCARQTGGSWKCRGG